MEDISICLILGSSMDWNVNICSDMVFHGLERQPRHHRFRHRLQNCCSCTWSISSFPSSETLRSAGLFSISFFTPFSVFAQSFLKFLKYVVTEGPLASLMVSVLASFWSGLELSQRWGPGQSPVFSHRSDPCSLLASKNLLHKPYKKELF